MEQVKNHTPTFSLLLPSLSIEAGRDRHLLLLYLILHGKADRIGGGNDEISS